MSFCALACFLQSGSCHSVPRLALTEWVLSLCASACSDSGSCHSVPWLGLTEWVMSFCASAWSDRVGHVVLRLGLL